MSKFVTPVSAKTIEQVLVAGDLSQLTSEQRVSYVGSVCKSLGLNHLTRPFEFITLNGKLTLYAKRDATDQLRKIHQVSIKITAREVINGVYVVTAQARMPNGREDESTGAVAVENLKGDALANAYLKSESKAKRRVTLSICGLGLLDETEVETIERETAHPANPLKQLKHNKAASLADVNPAEYKATFGKFKGLKLGEIDLYELNSYVEFIKNEAMASGKTIKGQVAEFMAAANMLLDTKDSALAPIFEEFPDSRELADQTFESERDHD